MENQIISRVEEIKIPVTSCIMDASKVINQGINDAIRAKNQREHDTPNGWEWKIVLITDSILHVPNQVPGKVGNTFLSRSVVIDLVKQTYQ